MKLDLNKPRLVFAVLVALVLSGIVLVAWSVSEPKCQGKSLTAWLDIALRAQLALDPQGKFDTYAEELERASNAIVSIGDPATPHLLRMVKTSAAQYPALERFEDFLYRHAPWKVRVVPRDYSDHAVIGFRILGVRATNALPGLFALLTSTNQAASYLAASCLGNMGEAGIDSLAAALTNASLGVQSEAASVLRGALPAHSARLHQITLDALSNPGCLAAPHLLLWVGDAGVGGSNLAAAVESIARNPGHRFAGVALQVAPELVKDPDRFLPLLSERVRDPRFAYDAAFALYRRGESSLPALLLGFGDKRPEVKLACSLAVDMFHVSWFALSETNAPWEGRLAARSFYGENRLFTNRARIAAVYAVHPWTLGVYLAELLQQCSPEIQLELVRGLGDLGPSGLLGLIRASESTNATIRKAAAQVLAGFDVEFHSGAITRGSKKVRQIALVFTVDEPSDDPAGALDDLRRQNARASFFFSYASLTNESHGGLIPALVEAGHYLGAHVRPGSMHTPGMGQESSDVLQRIHALDPAAPFRPEPRFRILLCGPENLEPSPWEVEERYLPIGDTLCAGTLTDNSRNSGTNLDEHSARHDDLLRGAEKDPAGLNGSILVRHLNARPGRDVAALVERLRDEGYTFVAIDELLLPEMAAARLQRTSARAAFLRKYFPTPH